MSLVSPKDDARRLPSPEAPTHIVVLRPMVVKRGALATSKIGSKSARGRRPVAVVPNARKHPVSCDSHLYIAHADSTQSVIPRLLLRLLLQAVVKRGALAAKKIGSKSARGRRPVEVAPDARKHPVGVSKHRHVKYHLTLEG